MRREHEGARLPGVSLQINLAPTDLPHARWILPHHIRQWGEQVEEIVLTVDLLRSAGRYGEAWRERLPGIRALVEGCRAGDPRVRALDVDYSPEMRRHLAGVYFGGTDVPAKDMHGAPFYAYFFGFHVTRHRYVLHMDSDMLYGGGSRTWVSEAVDLLRRRQDVLGCNPLPGPPTADGTLRSQRLEREPGPGLAFRADQVSTRILLLDMERFAERVLPLPMLRPRRLRGLLSSLEGHDRCQCAEIVLSTGMRTNGLWRVDLLGSGPGMWSLHPPHRSARFYACLPELVDAVERGQVAEAQRGCHDVENCTVDWSDARRARGPRWSRHARLIGAHAARRLLERRTDRCEPALHESGGHAA